MNIIEQNKLLRDALDVALHVIKQIAENGSGHDKTYCANFLAQNDNVDTAIAASSDEAPGTCLTCGGIVPYRSCTGPAEDAPRKQTDLSKRLLESATRTDGLFSAVSVLKQDLIAICCESNRYYNAMMAWKQAAEKKDEAMSGMTQRFLRWPLPKTFNPSFGISFDERKDDECGKNKIWPIGANLFDAKEAEGMFKYCLAKELK